MPLRATAPDFRNVQVQYVLYMLSNIYISVVILYAAMHLKHGTNYKLLQILTILHTSSAFDVPRTRIRISHTDRCEERKKTATATEAAAAAVAQVRHAQNACPIF